MSYIELQFSVGVNALLMISERTFSSFITLHHHAHSIHQGKKNCDCTLHIKPYNVYILRDSDTNAFTKSMYAFSISGLNKKKFVWLMHFFRHSLRNSQSAKVWDRQCVCVFFFVLFVKWRDFSCTICHFTMSTAFERTKICVLTEKKMNSFFFRYVHWIKQFFH